MVSKRVELSGFLLLFTTCLFLFSVTSVAKAQQTPTPPSSGDSDAQRTAWFRQAKFGMFIHWGPYSLASVEASWPIMRPSPHWNITEAEYVALYQRFNPMQFDPQGWVRLASDAGMRYMVFTTKHHDGFCMFDTALTDYKITKTPYERDVTAMLAKAAHDAQMPLGFYYSCPDMHHPGYRDTTKLASTNWRGEPTRPEWATFLDYMEGQLRELLTEYGPVADIWFDGGGKNYDGQRFTDLIHHLQPGTLINNRIGGSFDYVTPEQFVPDRIPTKSNAQHLHELMKSQAPADANLPAPDDFQLWESCMTISGTWAYNKNDTNYKSTQELIRDLVDVASKGGNLLLDVGPTPEGTIQPEFVERLQGMGKWMKVYGDSIYGTAYGPLQNLTFGKTTAKGKTIYLHVFDWPSDDRLEIAGFPGRVAQVILMGDRRKLHWQQANEKLVIQLPGTAPDPNDTVVQVVMR